MYDPRSSWIQTHSNLSVWELTWVWEFQLQRNPPNQETCSTFPHVPGTYMLLVTLPPPRRRYYMLSQIQFFVWDQPTAFGGISTFSLEPCSIIASNKFASRGILESSNIPLLQVTLERSWPPCGGILKGKLRYNRKPYIRLILLKAKCTVLPCIHAGGAPIINGGTLITANINFETFFDSFLSDSFCSTLFMIIPKKLGKTYLFEYTILPSYTYRHIATVRASRKQTLAH